MAGHVYLTGRESTRLTIKKRGDQGVGGHHWMIEKEERLFELVFPGAADVQYEAIEVVVVPVVHRPR